MVGDESDPPPTTCPECGVGCQLTRGPDPDRARGRKGPANPDGRLCRRGATTFGRPPEAERLRRPRVRRDGELTPVSWETAMAAAAEGLADARDATGPDSLAFLGAPRCTNEENYLLQKLARLCGTNNVDNRARLCHDQTARALADRLGWPASTNGLDGLRSADVILVVGANPAARQPMAFDSFVRPAVRDGATLVHLDPVGNETTRLADVHLAPRPGTDALLLDHLSARVDARGGVAESFVADRTRDADRYREELTALERGDAAAVAGVDDAAVDRVAELLCERDRTAAVVGTGIDGQPPVSAPDALLNLLLLTGNVGRPGTGLYVFRGLVNEQGATDAGCVPDKLPGHVSVTDADARERVGSVWGVDPPKRPGLDAKALVGAFGDAVRAALVVGENPAVSKRPDEWLDRRLGGLDTLVLVDAAETATTPYADVVLPAATGVEKRGTVTNLDRTVQRVRPVRDPPGDARPDFEVLRELGSRLTAPAQFDFDGPDEAFDELADVSPAYAGLSVGETKSSRQWPGDAGSTLYEDGFETADGRARFVGVQPPVDAGDDDGLRLVSVGRANDDAATRGERDRVRIHPDDAAARDVATGETVAVTDGETVVEAVAETTDDVRRGTAVMHAAIADPLERRGDPNVAVRPLRSAPATQE
ncbi:molybdopterin oxidoreductase family protein [Haloarcula marina]|uniref:molybdopterin oxidoreductase family protein n=1 Tax=Haloarcula marina TaxID=2961574 RepID=UPI0020B76716|nr:molybdopterin-dependent oxidoreductase [Halomicroarcula marina]